MRRAVSGRPISRLAVLGFLLCLLIAGPLVSPRAEEWSYQVRLGDTIWDLAQRYLRDPNDWPRLQALNDVSEPRRLTPGSIVRFPLDWLRLDHVTARVAALHGDVTVERAEGGVAGLRVGDLLGRGDIVETAAEASAQLILVDGSTLVLASESRLELDRLDAYRLSGAARTAVGLARGRLDSHVPSGDGAASRFEVRTPPAVSAVRGTTFRMAVDTTGTHATTEVVDGRVRVTGAGRHSDVDAGHGLVAVAGKSPGRPRRLLEPPPVAAVPNLIEQVPLSLPAPPQPGAVAWRFSILPQRSDVPLYERTYARPGVRGPLLPDGHYRVRLRAIDAEALEGLDREWAVEIDARPEPPALLSPTKDGRVRQARPAFAWASQENAGAYRLQVASDPGFATRVIDIQVADAAEAVSPVALPEGQWYWRAAAIDAEDQGPFADPQPFERRDPPSAGTEFGVDDDRLVARVRGGLPGQRHHFQLADNRDFTPLIVDSTQIEPELVYAKPLPGRYYLRTLVIDDDGYIGEFGPVQQIDVPPTAWWPAVAVPLVMLLLAL